METELETYEQKRKKFNELERKIDNLSLLLQKRNGNICPYCNSVVNIEGLIKEYHNLMLEANKYGFTKYISYTLDGKEIKL